MKKKHTLDDGTELVRGDKHNNSNLLDGRKHEEDPFSDRLTAAEKLTAPKLTAGERKEWLRALKVIEKGWKAFVEVGLALKQIRESRLYREDFVSWEAFCREVVGISKTEANRMIIDAEVVETLQVTPIGVTEDEPLPLPENRAQARALSLVKDAENRRQVWKEVVTKSAGTPISARVIAEATTPLITRAPKERPTVSPDHGVERSGGANPVLGGLDVLDTLKIARQECSWSLVDKVIRYLEGQEKSQ